MCSIPGCSGSNNVLKQNKLHRVPAIALGSSGLMLDLTKKRREKWFEILKDCGLTEDNSSTYKICSNHFKEDKPSSTFDVENEDWVPTMNLPGTEIQSMPVDSETSCAGNEELMETESTSIVCPISSDIPTLNDSTDIPTLNNSTDIPTLNDSTDISTLNDSNEGEENTEETSETLPPDPPFIFVDIKKITEDNSSLIKETEESNVNSISKDISDISEGTRTFGVQTNPNVLPPLNWGRRKLKKLRDSRFQNVQIQTDPISKFKLAICEKDPVQACLGEIIEFIRKQILGFNLTALGKSFTIKECALHVEGHEEVNIFNDKENKVVVQPSRLLSSNWPLLESVAMGVDLYRLQQKNKQLTGFVRTLTGKSEVIEQTSNILEKNDTSKVYKQSVENEEGDVMCINDENQNGSTLDDVENSVPDSNGIISPVMPKITQVMSLGDQSNDFPSTPSPSNQPKPLSKKKIGKLSSLNLVSTLTHSTPSISSTKHDTTTTPANLPVKRKRGRPKSIAKIKAAEEMQIQLMLSTNKVPRVILPKLPGKVLDKVLNGEKFTVKNLNSPFDDASKTEEKSQVSPTKLTSPLLLISNVNKEDSSGPDAPIEFQTVKNIPLKLGQTKDVAGYLLLAQPGGATGSSQIMYVPKVPSTDNSDIKSNLNVNFENLLKKGVKTLLVPSNFLPKVSSGTAQAVLSSSVTTMPSSSVVTDSTSSTNTSCATKEVSSNSDIIKMKIKSPKRQKKKKDVDDNEEKPKKRRNRKVYDDSIDDFDDFMDVEVTEPEPVDKEMRCPYCNLVCKDGLDFINHRKTERCKGLRGMATQNKKCEHCKRLYKKDSEHDCLKTKSNEAKNPDCNVCGRVFTKYAYLSNHVKTHSEYDVWTDRCGACPKKFPNKNELSQHSKDCHSELLDTAKYTCGSCKKVFSTPKRLDHHIEKVHSGTNTSSKQCSIRIRCKICRNVFDLDHYRKTHWIECLEQKKKNEKNILEESKEEKKPTAIRSKIPMHKKKKQDESIEEQLCKIFGDDDDNNGHEESSESEYEHEELLSPECDEYTEQVPFDDKKEKKQEKNNKRSRFRNLYGSDSDGYEASVLKVIKLEKSQHHEDDPLMKVTKIERQKPEVVKTVKYVENSSTKFDFKNLLGEDDGTNDITIEEMEEDGDDYFA